MELLIMLLFHLSNVYKEVSCINAVPMPDFSALGRRISEQKCQEYNFERKLADQCPGLHKDLGPTDYPYMGALGYKKSTQSEEIAYHFLCAAFLISPKFALTAAQCLARTSFDPPEVLRFGNSNIEETNKPHLDAKIITTYPHPEYYRPKQDYDVGLVELVSNLQWSKSIQPVCLWNHNDVSEDSSWNVNFKSNSYCRSPENLKATKVEPMDMATCDSSISHTYNRFFYELESFHLCIRSSDEISCNGVAGGPVITKKNISEKAEDQMTYAIAITSIGSGCYKDFGITINTRVSSFIDWIEPIVWPHPTRV